MAAKVSVLVPVDVDSKVLKSSTAVETYADYVAGKVYKKGDRCVSPTKNRIFESLQDNNSGHDPAITDNLTGNTPWWMDYAPTNRMAMFDTDVSTATVAPSPLTVVLQPGFFRDLYLNLDADEVDLVVRDSPGGSVIRATHEVLEGSQPGDYDEYFFGRFEPRYDFIAQDIEPYNAAEITLTLTSASGTVSCAVMDVGDLIALGDTLVGAKVTPKTYSYVDQDKFGGAKIVRRGAANDLAITGILDRSESPMVHRTLMKVLDTPVLVTASTGVDYSPLRNFGLVSGGIEYPNIPDKCNLNINVQGLIRWQ
ncbi:hypothetical protein GJ698_22150 [Pseudoduganella sp. FT26W]|uniref:Uncharacterized protein n=1 Tax=Duganella aquatilis TaxID=2666082 RepID=A0A844D129_9BURK|nr:hypothetical protein [Duganella aquatilis]MRW86777.1 hypothetical protein [Duganella aquatilis]